MEPALECGLYSQRDPLGIGNFHLWVVVNWRWLLSWGWELLSTSFSQLWVSFSFAPMQALCMLPRLHMYTCASMQALRMIPCSHMCICAVWTHNFQKVFNCIVNSKILKLFTLNVKLSTLYSAISSISNILKFLYKNNTLKVLSILKEINTLTYLTYNTTDAVESNRV